MRHFLGLTVASVAVMLATAVNASAYIVTVKANHQAGPPAKATPSGTGSVPLDDVFPPYKVTVDYGTFVGGEFKLWGAAPSVDVTINPAVDGNFNWTVAAAMELPANPPAGLHVRARLRRERPIIGWVEVEVAYGQCP